MTRPDNPAAFPAGLLDGDIPCRSCPAKDWECYPAVSYATWGSIQWPVCRMHEEYAMCAGWFPITPINGHREMVEGDL